MTHVITSLCLRDGACVEVCPVECILPGLPENEWPWYFIDPDTCIDCGACIPECPYEAIFPDPDEVPQAYELADDQEVRPFGGTPYKEGGKIIDLTDATQHNADFFKVGPGYSTRK
jgi:ferredoxin